MIVVSDTSPLNYLVLLGVEHVLPKLFGDVFVPPAVLAELARLETPDPVRRWAIQPPDWLRLRTPISIMAGLDLDRGETEAISLFVELKGGFTADRRSQRAPGCRHAWSDDRRNADRIGNCCPTGSRIPSRND